MGRTPALLAGPIESGVGARPDCDESIAPVGVSPASPGTSEIRIKRKAPQIDRIDVAAGSIGLPRLDQCVAYRTLIAIGDPPEDDDPCP